MSVFVLCSVFSLRDSEVNATVYSETISLYTNVVCSLNAGDVRKYYLTVNESGYYAVETSGNTDTYGMVSAYNNQGLQSYYDDDGGAKRNCLVRFYQRANTTSVITIRHYNSTSGTGTFGIQVRKQRAAFFTNQYSNGGLDTVAQATNPYSITNQLGFKSVKFINAGKNDYKHGDGQSNCRYINSDIFMYSGHGHEGYITLPSSEVISETTLINEPAYSMHSTNLALWNACYSAVTPTNSSALSMIDASVQSGAKCAVGWNDEVYPNSLVIWTDNFFDEIHDGYSVLDSAISSSSQFLLMFDHCRTACRMAGDNTISILAEPNSSTNSISSQETLKLEMQENLNKYSYSIFELEDNSKRYYRTINGTITNEYYDEYPNGYLVKSKCKL